MAAKRVQPAAPSAITAARPGSRAVAIALLAAVPLFVAGGVATKAQAVDVTAAAVALAGLVAALMLVVTRRSVWPVGRLGFAWSGFVAVALLASLASGRVWGALVGEPGSLLGWCALAALTAIAIVSSDSAPGLRTTLSTYGPWLLAAESLFALSQAVAGGAGGGTLPNSTYFGEFALLLLPFTLPGHNASGRGRAARVACVALTLVALGASGSRVALVAAAAWAAWALWRSAELGSRAKLGIAVAVSVAVVAAVAAFASAEFLGGAGMASLGERPGMLRVTAAAVAARPLAGWGSEGYLAGGTAVTTPELFASGPAVVFRVGDTDPHNLLANVAVSTGLLGLALFAWAAFELVREWRARSRAGIDVAPGVWGACMLGVVLLTAPLTVHVVPLLGVVLGVSLAPARKPVDAGPRRTAGIALAAVLGLACTLLLVTALARFSAEEFGAANSPAAAPRVARLSAVLGADAYLAYLSAMHWGYAAIADPAIAAERPDAAAISRATRLDAHSPFFALEQARTLRFYRESPEVVIAAYEKAIARYPAFPLAHAELARYLADQGQAAEAERLLGVAELPRDRDPERLAAIRSAREAIAAAR